MILSFPIPRVENYVILLYETVKTMGNWVKFWETYVMDWMPGSLKWELSRSSTPLRKQRAKATRSFSFLLPCLACCPSPFHLFLCGMFFSKFCYKIGSTFPLFQKLVAKVGEIFLRESIIAYCTISIRAKRQELYLLCHIMTFLVCMGLIKLSTPGFMYIRN